MFAKSLKGRKGVDSRLSSHQVWTAGAQALDREPGVPQHRFTMLKHEADALDCMFEAANHHSTVYPPVSRHGNNQLSSGMHIDAVVHDHGLAAHLDSRGIGHK